MQYRRREKKVNSPTIIFHKTIATCDGFFIYRQYYYFKILFLDLLDVNLHSDKTDYEQKGHTFFDACHIDAFDRLFTGEAL